jgi:hypothetical protein
MRGVVSSRAASSEHDNNSNIHCLEIAAVAIVSNDGTIILLPHPHPHHPHHQPKHPLIIITTH